MQAPTPSPGIYTVVPVDEGNLPQVGQKALQALLAQWMPLCSDTAKAVCTPQDWNIGADTLPPITLEDLNRVLKESRVDAGLGKERLHPRTILVLSDDCKLRLIDLLHAWEERSFLAMGRTLANVRAGCIISLWRLPRLKG